MLEVGDQAPKFALLSDESKTVSLADFKGSKLVVYFYPKDNTPGCTIESQGFKQLFPEFKKNNTKVIGVSKDSVASHQKFKKLTFKF